MNVLKCILVQKVGFLKCKRMNYEIYTSPVRLKHWCAVTGNLGVYG